MNLELPPIMEPLLFFPGLPLFLLFTGNDITNDFQEVRYIHYRLLPNRPGNQGQGINPACASIHHLFSGTGDRVYMPAIRGATSVQ
jgi:hypothetical protein